MKSRNERPKLNRRVQLMLVVLATLGVTGGGWRLDATPAISTWTVTKTADTRDGVCNADCSLREAIAAAASGDTIQFSSLFNSPQTITLSWENGPEVNSLGLSKSLSIQGPGANLLTISGNHR